MSDVINVDFGCKKVRNTNMFVPVDDYNEYSLAELCQQPNGVEMLVDCEVGESHQSFCLKRLFDDECEVLYKQYKSGEINVDFENGWKMYQKGVMSHDSDRWYMIGYLKDDFWDKVDFVGLHDADFVIDEEVVVDGEIYTPHVLLRKALREIFTAEIRLYE